MMAPDILTLLLSRYARRVASAQGRTYLFFDEIEERSSEMGLDRALPSRII